MDTGQLVVVSCGAPREKFWGVLQSLSAVGATVRAVPLDAFEDFASQFREGQQVLIAPMTVFLPGHRLERIEVDESGGGIEGLADRFAAHRPGSRGGPAWPLRQCTIRAADVAAAISRRAVSSGT